MKSFFCVDLVVVVDVHVIVDGFALGCGSAALRLCGEILMRGIIQYQIQIPEPMSHFALEIAKAKQGWRARSQPRNPSYLFPRLRSQLENSTGDGYYCRQFVRSFIRGGTIVDFGLRIADFGLQNARVRYRVLAAGTFDDCVLRGR